MKVHKVVDVLAAAPELVITASTTPEEVRATAQDFGTFDEHRLSGRRWQGLSPWERHPDGDELLVPLEGEVDVTLLPGEGKVRVTLAAGSILVVPRGVWHRQYAARTVLSFGVNSLGRDEISFADDPRAPA
jgi:mannose-6-phosphate isomerase-like protein (cupin superfamily)